MLMSKFQADQGEFDEEDPAEYLKLNNKRFAAPNKASEESVKKPEGAPVN